MSFLKKVFWVLCVALIFIPPGLRAETEVSPDLNWIRKSADRGDYYNQYLLGQYYAQGKGVPQDYIEAEKWFRKSAELDYLAARSELAWLYFHGLGVKQDRPQAYMWMTFSQDCIHCRFFGKEGRAFREKIISSTTPDEVTLAKRLTADWHEKRALKGDYNSQYELGRIFENGEGRQKDQALAIKWYLEAARYETPNDHADPYQQGHGFLREYSSYQYYRSKSSKAAERLSFLYSNGMGVRQDYSEAYLWLYFARGLQDNPGLEPLISKMTPEQAATVRKRVEDMEAARHPPVPCGGAAGDANDGHPC